MRLCFTINNKRYCIEIPLLYDRFWKFRKPEPEPWLRGLDIAQDLQVLASIAGLARDLSPELARTLNAGIEQAVSGIKSQLPEGAELYSHEKTAA